MRTDSILGAHVKSVEKCSSYAVCTAGVADERVGMPTFLMRTSCIVAPLGDFYSR
jgi:hypothetical protein